MGIRLTPRLVVIALLVIVAATAAVVVVGSDSGGGESESLSQPTSGTASTSLTQPPTTQPTPTSDDASEQTARPWTPSPAGDVVAPAGLPDTVIALADDGQLVELSATDGSLRRALARFGEQEVGDGSVELAPDGKEVWVSVNGEIHRLDLETLDATRVTEGRVLRLSRDGSRLAYTTFGGGVCNGTLRVRDLLSGSETVWQVTDEDQRQFKRCIDDITWSPQDTRLVFSLGWENIRGTYLLDPSDPNAALTDRRIDREGFICRNPEFIDGTGLLTVQEYESSDRLRGEQGFDDDGLRPLRVASIDLDTGESVSDEVHVEHRDAIAYDSGGDHALLIEREDEIRALYRWSVGGQRERISDRIVDADW